MVPNSGIRSVLIDLSGTLHIGNKITPSAIGALERLRENNFKIKFVTNTTKESRRILHERLCNLGFKIKADEIWSSLWAARDAIASRSLKPLLLVSDDALEDFEDNQLFKEVKDFKLGHIGSMLATETS